MSFDGICRLRPSSLRPAPPNGCEYCARTDGADSSSNCRGCGAPIPTGDRIDVTTVHSTVKECAFFGKEKP